MALARENNDAIVEYREKLRLKNLLDGSGGQSDDDDVSEEVAREADGGASGGGDVGVVSVDLSHAL